VSSNAWLGIFRALAHVFPLSRIVPDLALLAHQVEIAEDPWVVFCGKFFLR
jgi:hypothetical protein